MNPLRRLLGQWLKRSAPTTDATFALARLRQDADPDPFSAHATVYKCVSLITESLSAIPWKVMSGTEQDPTEVQEGPWYRLFNRPNPLMSRSELKGLSAEFMVLTGECFWVLDSGRPDQILGEGEIPLFIWPKSGADVTEVVDGNGQLRGWRIGGVRDNVVREYPLHSVIQLAMTRDPVRPWRGASPLRSVMTSIRSDYEAMRFNRFWYENGAAPGGTLETKDRDLTPQQAMETQKVWNDAHKGSANANKVAVLPYGLSFNGQSIKFADMQFLEGLRWGRSQVAQVFGVPLPLLGDGADVQFNTLRNMRRMFYEATVLPLARKIEDQIECQLIEPRLSVDEAGTAQANGGRAVWVEFAVDDLPVLQDDIETRLNAATKSRDLGFTKNEVNKRYRLGMEADEEIGDTRFLPSTLTTADALLNPPEPPAAPPPFGGGSVPTPPGEPPAPAKDPKGELTKNPEPSTPVRARDAAAERTRRDTLWRAYDSSLRPHERAYRSKLSRFNHDKTVEVVKWLQAARASRTSEEVLAFLEQKRSEWAAELQAIVRPLNLAAATSGVRQMGEQLGALQSMSVAHPDIVRFLADKELKITTVAETMVEGLRSTLLEGVSANETTAELADRVRDTSVLSKSSALRIARTEANQVVSGARFVTAKGEGVSRIEWSSSRDAMVRDEHQQLDGEVRAIDESFVPGQTLRYPGDIECGDPSLIINCRCFAGPAPE